MTRKIVYTFLLLLFTGFASAQFIKPTSAVLQDMSQFTKKPALRSLTVQKVYEVKRLAQTDASCFCNSGCFTTPVTLLAFSGERTSNSNVLLKWKTTNELHNDGFEVERSLGNTSLFSTVGYVNGKGGIAIIRNYHLNAYNTYQGISYYRLKQIDVDGKFTYSDVIAVKGYENAPTMMLYPNPVSTELAAAIYFPRSVTAKVIIFDATQKQVFTKTVSLNKGSSMVKIPVQLLSSGIYFVKVTTTDNDILFNKFVKL